MFGKKRRKAQWRVTVRGADGRVLAEAPLAEFPLPETAVIRLSVEYFNDLEPCEIHRAAVRSRAMQELREACPEGRETALNALPEDLRDLLPEGAATVRIAEVPA